MSLLVLKADEAVTDQKIVSEAKRIDEELHTRQAVVIFKQLDTNPKNCLLCLCQVEKLDATLEKLTKLNYTNNPGKYYTDPFKIRDRQKVSMFIDENSNLEFKPRAKKQLTFSIAADFQTVNTKLDGKASVPVYEDLYGTFKVEISRDGSEEPDNDLDLLIEVVCFPLFKSHLALIPLL